MHIGLGTGHNRIGIGRLPGHDTPGFFHPHADRGLCVCALGHRMHLIKLQTCVMREQVFDRVKGRIDRPVAFGLGRLFNAINRHGQRRLLRPFGAADHAQVLDLQAIAFTVNPDIDQRNQIFVIDLFLAIGQFLEAHEHIVKLIIGQIIAQIMQFRAQSGTARMFAHHDIGFRQTHIRRAHDLEGFGVLEHAILMDARFMGKGVLADDRLVELHRKPRHRRHPARDVHDLGGVDARGIGHDIATHLECHHHLFQRGVARAFAKAVDGTFNLTRAACDGGQGIGGRHAKVVMAMGGKDHLIGAGHRGDQTADQVSRFNRRCIANCVGNVDRAGPGLDRDFDRAAQIIPLGAGGIHWRPLHVVTQVAGMGHGLVDTIRHLILVEIRDRPVKGRGADKGVDARLRSTFHRLPAAVDILDVGACQPADHGIFRVLGNLAHGAEITFRGDGKAGLDDIDAHIIQQPGNLELFGMGHGGAGGLLAIAQSGVKNHYTLFLSRRGDAVFGLISHFGSLFVYPKPAARKGTSSERSRRAGTLRGGLGLAGQPETRAKWRVSWAKAYDPAVSWRGL